MTTYRFRIRFHIAQKGMIQAESKEISFMLSNGHSATLVANDSETINGGARFALLSGGYKDLKSAQIQGEIVKESLLCYASKNRMGIDLGKDVASSFLSNDIKNRILEEHETRVLDDVHGLCVFPEDKPTRFIGASGIALLNPRDIDYFSNELNRIISIPKELSAKVRMAMELLSFSYFEKHTRSRFLTLVLSAESLLTPDERSEKSKKHVNGLIEQTKKSTLSESERSSIIGSLSWLRTESISRSLMKMAETYLSGRTYGKLDAKEFITRCYEARSQLVHNGYVKDDKHNIGFLAANLEVYLRDMVTEIAGV